MIELNISDQRNSLEQDYENDFDDDEADDRKKRADRAANAALRRQSNVPPPVKTPTNVIFSKKFFLHHLHSIVFRMTHWKHHEKMRIYVNLEHD